MGAQPGTKKLGPTWPPRLERASRKWDPILMHLDGSPDVSCIAWCNGGTWTVDRVRPSRPHAPGKGRHGGNAWRDPAQTSSTLLRQSDKLVVDDETLLAARVRGLADAVHDQATQVHHAEHERAAG